MTLQDWQDSLRYVKTLHEGSKLANLPFAAHGACQESANKLAGYFQYELNKAQKRAQKRAKVINLEDASTRKDIPASSGS